MSVKVNDGIVLASDSATTLFAEFGGQLSVAQVYYNANKIFNLRKGLPIGGMTWGAGSIGRASISTLIKDLRDRFTDGDAEWRLDPKAYTVEEVAQKTRRFLFEEHYRAVYTQDPKPGLGFLVVGYSAKGTLAEEFLIQVENGQCPAPMRTRQVEQCGCSWYGEPEAIIRLVLGCSPMAIDALIGMQVPIEQARAAYTSIWQHTQTMMVHDAMPIQDAIDLGEFLVDLTERYSRFKQGAATVGGPIEVAAITKHEGYKWVKRKHYFSDDLNDIASPRESVNATK